MMIRRMKMADRLTNVAMQVGLSVGILVLASCMNTMSEYERDGVLIDHGLFSSKARFELDFGEINLEQGYVNRYCMVGVPSEKYTFGIEVVLDGMVSEIESEELDLILRYEFYENGELKTVRENAIGNWIWSFSRKSNTTFIYLRGTGTQHAIENINAMR